MTANVLNEVDVPFPRFVRGKKLWFFQLDWEYLVLYTVPWIYYIFYFLTWTLKLETRIMIIFDSVLLKLLQGSCLFCSLQWFCGAIWWLFSLILVLYLKTGGMMLKIVGILHFPLQRSKEVLLDIVLAVKMANLPAVIIVLFVSHLSCGWQLTFQLMTTAWKVATKRLFISDSLPQSHVN